MLLVIVMTAVVSLTGCNNTNKKEKNINEVSSINTDFETLLLEKYDLKNIESEKLQNLSQLVTQVSEIVSITSEDLIQNNISDSSIETFCEDNKVDKQNDLYIEINENANNVAQCKYYAEFSEGLLSVKKSGLYGYINEKGEVVIPFRYEEAEKFLNGFAKVKREGK